MFIVTYRKIFFAIGILLVVASGVALSLWGLRPGLDFTGGTLIEVQYQKLPTVEEVTQALGAVGYEGATLRKAGETNYIIRLPEVKTEDRAQVQEALVLGEAGGVEKRFSTVGPVLGREAIANSAFALILVVVGIILFIWRAFRNITAPIPSWKYGVVAIIALIHDVVIPMGVFAVLGAFAGVEVDSLFVTALLVILGFSIHDTIVVFDRVRENLHTATSLEKKDFARIVGKSISETFVRSLNTSLTTIFAIVALMIFGPESVRLFAVALLIGIGFGTYSSIFIASPLLVTLDAFQNRAGK